jgi:hypothetical protein
LQSGGDDVAAFFSVPLLYGAGHASRALVLFAWRDLRRQHAVRVGQALNTRIAAAPFLTRSTRRARERTHLFSAFFATELLAGVLGAQIGGWLPGALQGLPPEMRPFACSWTYRWTLMVGALLDFASVLPILRLRGLEEAPLAKERARLDPREQWRLLPIAVNAFLMGSGAGLVIPFMNLYFKSRFDCSSAQIGMFFSVAQILTAAAMMLGPVVARRFGKLRTATGSQILSLPFLVTLGAERRLETAVGAFWIRATLMAGRDATDRGIRHGVLAARPASAVGQLHQPGVEHGLGGERDAEWRLIVRFGYAVPFYVTAALYFSAALWLYRSFRHVHEQGRETALSEEAKVCARRADDRVRSCGLTRRGVSVRSARSQAAAPPPPGRWTG